MSDKWDVRPSIRQLQWQKTEFYGFIHFGINTFTDREWGDGQESPSLFNPPKINCQQWIKTLKKSGMQGAILTCKHHDGFCLWPSECTSHSVKKSPWLNGNGDVVKEFSNACKKEKMKFGIYLSPWDQAEISYGTGEAYNDFFINQLTELLTNYGEIFEVWFDGANGEKEGKKQIYDWERYYQLIRKLQPHAVIAVCGPDVRWVGNEAGQARENEWSVVPNELRDVEKIAEHSQQIDDGQFARKMASSDEDLGSQKVLTHYEGQLIWYPAEVNTSIRPGWFYHKDEDKKIKSPELLFDLYQKAVGGNSTLLLNVPPQPNGEIGYEDQKVLTLLGEKIKQFDYPLITDLEINHFQENNDYVIEMVWAQKQKLNYLIVGEAIQQGQRVEEFNVAYLEKNQYKYLAQGQTIGYKRIVALPEICTKKIRVEIKKARKTPVIDKLSAFFIEN